MKRVAVFTATRAEYGLLYWLMHDLRAHPDFELQVIASGMHLSPEFGETWKQIEQDEFRIDAKVEMLLSSDTAAGVVKSMGVGLIGFADALQRLAPDLLVVLGDRFEALAVAQAALVMRIPVAHLHGGEITEGAYDDAMRHAITKMASLHFTAAEPYRRRVIQMGESPDTVFNVGALGLDHLRRSPAMPLDEAAASLGLPLSDPYFLVTYHPVTAGDEDPATTTAALLRALDAFPGHRVVLTYPNADNGGRGIIAQLEAHARARADRVVAVPSLGFRRYLALLDGAAAVIGNSSSGIIEAPARQVPTVDIGIRQRGRLAAACVLHCAADEGAIRQAIEAALAPSFRATCRSATNPYGDGDAAGAILRVLQEHPWRFAKTFHDLEPLA
jgi:UDP-N-acetylglucosamine 2-epimerase (non-hydrolysing)